MYILFAILAFAGAVYLWFLSQSYFKRAREIRDTPTSDAGACRDGLVKLHGRAIPLEVTVPCPFTALDTLYCTYKVEVRRSTGRRHGHTWRTVKTGTQFVPFMLEDHTGRVNIYLSDARVLLQSDYASDSGFLDDPDDRVMDFLDREGISYEGFLGINETMRYRASRLTPGESISVFARARGGVIQGDSLAVVSDGSPDALDSHFVNQARLSVFGGAALCIVAVVLCFTG